MLFLSPILYWGLTTRAIIGAQQRKPERAVGSTTALFVVFLMGSISWRLIAMFHVNIACWRRSVSWLTRFVITKARATVPGFGMVRVVNTKTWLSALPSSVAAAERPPGRRDRRRVWPTRGVVCRLRASGPAGLRCVGSSRGAGAFGHLGGGSFMWPPMCTACRSLPARATRL